MITLKMLIGCCPYFLETKNINVFVVTEEAAKVFLSGTSSSNI
jgi:hypothetical protein